MVSTSSFPEDKDDRVRVYVGSRCPIDKEFDCIPCQIFKFGKQIGRDKCPQLLPCILVEGMKHSVVGPCKNDGPRGVMDDQRP